MSSSPELELPVLLRSVCCVHSGWGGVGGGWAGRSIWVDSKALSSPCHGRLSPRHSPEQMTRHILAPYSDSLSVRTKTLHLHYSNLVGSLVWLNNMGHGHHFLNKYDCVISANGASAHLFLSHPRLSSLSGGMWPLVTVSGVTSILTGVLGQQSHSTVTWDISSDSLHCQHSPALQFSTLQGRIINEITEAAERTSL